MKKISKDSIMGKLVVGIEAGEQKTMREWAVKFSVEEERIHSALSSLRKRGYMYYPVGMKYRGGGGSSQGKVKNIAKNFTDYSMTMTRINTNFVNPHIAGIFRMIEAICMEDPTKWKEIEDRSKSLLKLIEEKKTTMEQRYVPSMRLKHGNPAHQR